MANIFSANSVVDGTNDDDIIIGVGTNQTINGGDRHDVIFDGIGGLHVDNGVGNGTISTAMNIDMFDKWSIMSNPDIGDSTIPYTTILAQGADEFDYFSVTVGAGETITLDIDHGYKSSGSHRFDSKISLLDINGLELSNNNNTISSSTRSEGLGSSGSFGYKDSYLTYTNDTASQQTYFIKVEQSVNTVIPAHGNYMLNVSVTGHAFGAAPPSGAGNLNGGAGDDIIYGMDGDDTINGDAGKDFIEGGQGADAMDGGTGIDTLSYSSSSAAVSVNLDSNSASGGDATGDTIINFENIFGSAFDDQLFGDANSNEIYGRGGDDHLFGFGGWDKFYGGDGDDTISVFSAHDTSNIGFSGGRGLDTLQIFGIGNATTFDVRDDNFYGIQKLQIDNFYATNSLDVQFTYFQLSKLSSIEAGIDVGHTNTISVFSDIGDYVSLERITFSGFSEAGDMVNIYGDSDSETIIGSSISDHIRGYDGDDEIQGGGGDDILEGGAGVNTLSYDMSEAGVTVDLEISAAQNTGGAGIDIVSDFENIIGSDFDDTLSGTSGDNFIEGGLGDDILNGRTGTDTLSYQGIRGVGVNVSLSFSLQDTGGAGIDTLYGFENLTGTYSHDLLFGDTLDNVIDGLGGDDLLRGGNGGIDTLIGNYGDDTFQMFSLFTNDITAGDSYDGGFGTDKFLALAAGGGTFDFRATTITSVETLEFQTDVYSFAGSNTTQFFASQFVNAGFETIEITLRNQPGSTFHLDLFLDTTTTLDLSSMSFSGFASQDDGVNIIGDADSETITGSSVTDSIQGNDGNDDISGGDGDDILDGGAGFDSVNGDAGNDRLMGSLQADVMDGGSGIDTADFSSSTNAQKINLVTNVNIGGNAHGDTLLNFEKVIGSDTRKDDITGTATANDLFGRGADDFLRGFHGDDSLFGEEGNDFLFGGTGADFMDGGNGKDWAMYNGLTTGVTVNLFTGYGFGGQAEGDTYKSIERVRGTNADDTITGTDSSNKLLGDGGNDTINGMGGKDVIRGGDGDDIINGGAGNDGLRGDAGSDTFIFEFGSGHDFVIDFEDNIDTLNIDNAFFRGLTVEQLVDDHLIMENDNRFHFDFGGGDVLHVLTTTAMGLSDFYDDVAIV